MEWFRQNEDMVIRIKEEITLKELLLKLNLKNIEHLINTKVVRVDKQKADAEYVCRKNDIVRIKAFVHQDIDFISEKMNLRICYEDDILLVVDKPSGILVHPDNKEGVGTLANGVAYYYEQQGLGCSVRHLHRLDTNTSGLVVFCKSPLLQPHFDELLSRKLINRKYYAFVDGYYRVNQKFSVDAPIGRDRHNAKKRRVSDSGKPAKTNFVCLASSKEHNLSMVECVLETGRTHQIRVHLAHHKHPIISDEIYGERNEYIDRMALQAYSLEIKSPLYPDGIYIKLPLAKDMKKAFKPLMKLPKME